MQAFFVWTTAPCQRIILTKSPAKIKKFILYMG